MWCALLFFTLFSCSLEQTQIDKSGETTIDIVNVYNNAALRCGHRIKNNDHDMWQIDTLAYFISALAVKTSASSDWQNVAFVPSDWQTASTALLWLDHDCNQLSNTHIRIAQSAKQWQHVEQVTFQLSIPFQENHANPLTQASPLNLPEMFWSWQLGHKFLRIDARKVSPPEKTWSFHLGSLGCNSLSVLRAPAAPCKVPNRYEFEVTANVDAQNSHLVFDILKLLQGVDLNTAENCMFNKNETLVCDQLSKNMGQALFSFATDEQSQ